MSRFLDKIKTGTFWKNTFRVALLFFSAIIIVALLFNSFKAIINLDFEIVRQANFSEGKWKAFFFPKVVLSMLYGMWVSARNMR